MAADNFDYTAHYKKDAKVFDYFKQRSGATAHDERRVHEFIISKVPGDTKIIADIGSGNAWAAQHFVKKNVSVISFDISHTNAVKARELVPDNKHMQLTGDSLKLPLKDNSIDVIIASEIIEHIINPAAFIKSLYRAVKPGGKLIVTTPYKEIIQQCLCIHCNNVTPLHGHLHSLDENNLIEYGKSAGTGKVDYSTFGNKALLFLRTYPLLSWMPFSLWKAIDRFANFFINKPAHIIAEYHKPSI